MLLTPVPFKSLEQSCLLVIGKRLYSRLQFLETLPNSGTSSSQPECPTNGEETHLFEMATVEDILTMLSSKLSLPQRLRDKVDGFVHRLNLQVYIWRSHHIRYLSLFSLIEIVKNVQWTIQGTIKKRETARIFVRDKNQDPFERFKLACLYCFEDDIRDLCSFADNLHASFQELSDEDYWFLYWVHHFRDLMPEVSHEILEELEWDPDTPLQRMFENSVENGNKDAAMYFLDKLSSNVDIRRTSISDNLAEFVPLCRQYAIISPYLVDVLVALYDAYCLSNKADQLLRDSAIILLKYLLNWPSCDVFCAILPKFCFLLTPYECYLLMENILQRNREECLPLFVAFWTQVPKDTKMLMIDEWETTTISSKIQSLFEVQDDQIAWIILADMTTTQRETIFLNDGGKRICRDLIESGRWKTLERFASEGLVEWNLVELEKFRHLLKFCEEAHFLDQFMDLHNELSARRLREPHS